jgi:hypothetical protein
MRPRDFKMAMAGGAKVPKMPKVKGMRTGIGN